MSDEIDRAQEQEQQMRDAALRQQLAGAGTYGKTAADSAAECEASGCGEPIPEPRRKAVPGCRFCTECQARHEKRKRAHP